MRRPSFDSLSYKFNSDLCFDQKEGRKYRCKGEGKDKASPVHAIKVYGESRGLAPLIRYLGTRWR
jgi:hypothetical protein